MTNLLKNGSTSTLDKIRALSKKTGEQAPGQQKQEIQANFNLSFNNSFNTSYNGAHQHTEAKTMSFTAT